MLRFLAYLWAAPATALGLLFAPLALLTGGRMRLVAGTIEIHGGLIAWLLSRAIPLPGGAMALTLGHCILGRSHTALDVARTHEHVHVRQYERWGPLFIPAYLLASAWLFLRRRDAYRDNPFERAAYATDPPPPQWR